MNTLVRRAIGAVPATGWLVAAVLYPLTVALTVLRLRQWGPDARYYLGWAYRYGGLSEAEAGRRTYEFLGSFSWFAPYCHGACGPDVPPSAYDQLFHGTTGGLVAPRVLYPLLSAPFVRMIGPPGMLVVPLVAYAVCLVLVMLLAARLVGRRWAVLAAVAMLLPVTVSRWSTYAYTEALSMALFMACVVVLPLGRRARRRDLILFGVFLLLFAFTRQFHLVVVGAVALAWLGGVLVRRRLTNEWLPFAGVAVGVTLLAGWLQSLMAPGYSIVESFLRHSGAGTLAGAPAATVRVAWRIVRSEVWFVGNDYPLVLVCALAAVGIGWRFRAPLCHAALGALLGTFVLHLLNTEPSNFRYYSIAFPLLAVVATAVVADLVGGRRPPAFDPVPAPAATALRPPPGAAAGGQVEALAVESAGDGTRVGSAS